MMNNWRRPSSAPPINIPERQRRWRQELTDTYGTPEENPAFWKTISPASYLADLSGPVQLHHGTGDIEVPVEFSRNVYQQAQDEGLSMPVEYFEYSGDNHNLSNNLGLALQRSVEFFDRYVKNAGG
jgi:dipeptidyl aminopeptidase/acylaminoacyl peptidase